MISSYIGLGSNLDDPQTQLLNALVALNNIPITQLVKYSSFYKTQPLGIVDQPDFINAVVALETDLSAIDLLDHLQSIENQQGRVRNGIPWGPRQLDMDILLYGNDNIDHSRLKVPHPEMCRREFVLFPLHEIAPWVKLPGIGAIEKLLPKMDASKIKKLSVNISNHISEAISRDEQ